MNRVKTIIVIVFLLLACAGGAYWWHSNEMKTLEKELTEEQEQKSLMDKRVKEIQEKLDSTESEKESLLDQIEEMMTKEVPVFDAEAMKEEILEIGELATMEYRFTNVGTIDSVKKFKFVNLKVPFSKKSAVITMDGVIKAGIDVNQVEITSDEENKRIIVKLPEAKILSIELYENTAQVYLEEESLFNKITLEDGGALRNNLKDRAQENAKKNGLLEDANRRAQDIIRQLIEVIPGIKDTYEIVFS